MAVVLELLCCESFQLF